MYDRPAQQQFIDTFTPIPFEQLYKLGQTFNEDVLRSEQELGDMISQWSQFQSPSAIDTQSWYGETMNRVKPVVEQMAQNLDLIKSPEGRAMIAQLRNTTDYNKLATLRQSREGMLQRQKANQELMSKGLYNPDWHDVDFANYNSLDPEQGIFNDVSPLAYKSIKDISDQYFNNLKPSYLYSKGLYDYKGITPETIQEIANDKINDIAMTPYGQKHLEILQRQGYTPEEAMQLFTNKVIGDNLEYTTIDREANPFRILDYRDSLSRVGQEEQSQPWVSPKQMYLHTAIGLSNEKKQRYASLANLTPEIIQTEQKRAQINAGLESKIEEAVKSNNLVEAQRLSKIYTNYNETTTKEMMNKQKDAYLPILNKYYRGSESRKAITSADFNSERFRKASTKMLDEVSADMPIPESLGILAASLGRKVYRDEKGNLVSDEKIFDVDSRELYFPQEISSSIIGNTYLGNGISTPYELYGQEDKTIYNDWRMGDIQDVKIVGTPGKVAVNVDSNGDLQYLLKVRVELPYNSLEQAGYKNVPVSLFKSRESLIKKEFGALPKEVNGQKYYYFDMYKPIEKDVLSNMGYDFDYINQNMPKSTSDKQKHQIVNDAINISVNGQ